MGVPKPPVALVNACSVIFDNALYVFQPGAFQRLALVKGAVWQKLPAGEEVIGGVCVGSTPKDLSRAGLYIVGGKGKTAGYSGLQKFTYSTGKWETILPTVAVTQERTWHGATYINSTDSILVYAGNQDGAQHPSSQTFTIQASPPYEVLAFQSIAPPAISPILMQWSETQAVMVGGGETNTRVMLFDPATSWTDSGTTLAEPIPKNTTAMQAVLVKGDDGSKNLYTFDMTQSPNEVQRIVLLDGAGRPIAKSATIAARASDEIFQGSTRERRELTLDHWPAYNGSLASTATRSNYAVAQDPDGLVVFSGGNEEDVLCIFDSRQNSWQNASVKLAEQKVLAATAPVTSLLASTTSATFASLTSRTSTASPTAAAIGSGSNSQESGSGMGSTALLGIVLGSIVGAVLVLALVLLLLRRRRKRRDHMEAGHTRRSSGISPNEKDGFAFANDSKPMGMGHFRGHQPSDSQGSYSSVAILMGRVGQPKELKRKPSNESRRTSTSSFFNKQFKSTISKPIPQLADHPALQTREEKGVSFAANVNDPRPQPRGTAVARQGSLRRSSGWNRYWSGGSALNLLGFGASKRTTVDSDQSSRYSQNNRITQDSATVPPFHFNLEGREKIKSVSSNSPRLSQFPGKIPMKDGMAGTIERPGSQDSFSGYSSGIPASVHDTWDPTATKKPWGSERAPNNAYPASFYPGLSLAGSSAMPTPPPPSSASQQPQLAMESSSSDMSWLNLGEYNRAAR